MATIPHEKFEAIVVTVSDLCYLELVGLLQVLKNLLSKSSQFLLYHPRPLVQRRPEHQAARNDSICWSRWTTGSYQTRKLATHWKVAGPAQPQLWWQLCYLARTIFAQNDQTRSENWSRESVGA